MADGASLVKSSYDDVNSALEGLVGNISSGSSLTMEQVNAAIANEASRAEKAEAALQAVIAAVQVPVWMPIPSPSATAPAGYIPANGATFSTTQYPQLGAAFPSGSVPDLRGLFIRGLDTSNLVDNFDPIDNIGRSVLSTEEGSYIINGNGNCLASSAYISDNKSLANMGQDVPYVTSHNPTIAIGSAVQLYPATPQQYTGYGVARPKNMAWNYVFRAA